MFGEFTEQDRTRPQNILIMDMVHGGDIIASRLLPLGYKITCADVYRVSTE